MKAAFAKSELDGLDSKLQFATQLAKAVLDNAGMKADLISLSLMVWTAGFSLLHSWPKQ